MTATSHVLNRLFEMAVMRILLCTAILTVAGKNCLGRTSLTHQQTLQFDLSNCKPQSAIFRCSACFSLTSSSHGGFDLPGTVLLQLEEYNLRIKKSRTEKMGGNYLTLGRNKPNSA